MGLARTPRPRQERPVVLVFGESDNDRAALVELFRALRPDHASVGVETRREPLILMKDENRRSIRRKTSDRIAALVRAEAVTRPVAAVIAHEDCDDTEPAHVTLAATIEAELTSAGVPHPIAATPAWEIETWWMLFPDALQATRPCWATFDHAGRDVGRIRHAKEELRRQLRPTTAHARSRCPDYAESDGIKIAAAIRSRNLIDQERGNAASLAEFKAKVRALAL